ncbi:MAG: putative enoyl-coA hydratase protein [Cryptosporangiaceae bacterium]|nr:putative enoyl-coA hydratase protein [Cryptosporangiaceae bacterium]
MTADVIAVRIDGRCARVSLARPDRRNAVNRAVVAGLSEVFADLARRDDVDVLVLDGQGPSFCAGGDIEEFTELARLGAAECERVFAGHVAMLDALGALPQVTVAVVHGVAAGLGVSLVSRCDLAVAADTARFLLPELAIGIVPSLVLVDALRAMPDKWARDWLLTGGQRTAAEALAAGLLSRVVAEPDLPGEAERIVAALGGTARDALRRTVEFLAEVGAADPRERGALSVREAGVAMGSPAAREGIQAYLERRAPRWPAAG